MKISFLLTQDINSPSSLGRFFPLAKELAKLGHQIKIFTLHGDFYNLKNSIEEKEGVEIKYLGQMQVLKTGSEKKYFKPVKLVFFMSLATIRFATYALGGNYDILYIGKPHPMNGLAGIIGKKVRNKILIVDCDDLESSVNHFQKNWQRRVISFFEDKVPKVADIVNTNTHFTRERLLKLGICEKHIYLLPNGIDRERFSQTDLIDANLRRRELKLEGKKVIGYIGTISIISHPIEILLEAINILKMEMDNIQLLIVGGGEDIPFIIKRTEELCIKELVTLVGKVPQEQIPFYYQLCDVSVDPVYDDDVAKARLPIKMFESWVSGVPFVTSNVGDRKIYLQNPISGLLTNDVSSRSLAIELFRALNDDKLMETVVENALKKSTDFFWDVLSKKFLNFVYGRISIK